MGILAWQSAHARNGLPKRPQMISILDFPDSPAANLRPKSTMTVAFFSLLLRQPRLAFHDILCIGAVACTVAPTPKQYSRSAILKTNRIRHPFTASIPLLLALVAAVVHHWTDCQVVSFALVTIGFGRHTSSCREKRSSF